MSEKKYRSPRPFWGLRLAIAPSALAGGLLLASGCTLPQSNTNSQPTTYSPIIGDGAARTPQKPAPPLNVERTEEHDDIYQVVSFVPADPWLRESGRVVGVWVPTYFISGKTNKGAFVPGTILAWIYGFEAGPDRPERVPLQIWEFDRNTAMGWRVTKMSRLGYPYQFYLRWPSDLNLEGQTIELELGYERTGDKTVVTGSPKRLKVPRTDLPRLRPPDPQPRSANVAATQRAQR
ncbi:MAG: hypothetical protein HZB38_07500 [Planctomycetes bacterium]|nr:hypothetical protein [Planctomycetota bacterium]